MLYITTTCPENLIKNVNGYFDSHKKKDWFNNDLVKKVIKDIDDTIAVKDEYMESPVLVVCHQIDCQVAVRRLF